MNNDVKEAINFSSLEDLETKFSNHKYKPRFFDFFLHLKFCQSGWVFPASTANEETSQQIENAPAKGKNKFVCYIQDADM